MEDAFKPGYDPALELSKPITSHKQISLFPDDDSWSQNLRRKEQDQIDAIVHGEEPGHYFVLLGPKVRLRPSISL